MTEKNRKITKAFIVFKLIFLEKLNKIFNLKNLSNKKKFNFLLTTVLFDCCHYDCHNDKSVSFTFATTTAEAASAAAAAENPQKLIKPLNCHYDSPQSIAAQFLEIFPLKLLQKNKASFF